MILTPAKAVSFVPIENPARQRLVIETASGQGMTRYGRCYTLEELSHGRKKKGQGERMISKGEAEEVC